MDWYAIDDSDGEVYLHHDGPHQGAGGAPWDCLGQGKWDFIGMINNEDGKVTREEFIQTCLSDLGLFEILTPNVCNYLGSFDTEPNK